MHLAFVTSLVPDGNPSTGYEIANAAIIAALRRQGVRVSVAGFVRPGKNPVDPENTIVLGEIDPATGNASTAQKVHWLATAISTGLTFSSAKLRILTDDAFEGALAALGEVDGYVLNAVQMTAAYETSLLGKPAIYVAHNVEHVSARQSAQSANGALERFLFAREARLLKQIERRLCDQARFVFTLSEDDRQALSVAGPGRSAVLPLVTRQSPVTPVANRPRIHDAALIGTWTWQPNRIGLDWFLDKVVRHLDPSFTVSIAGAMPSDLTSNRQNVHFAGRVADATEFVMGAGVIPLISRAGTGVQLKTIETFELGLPAVATTSSVRGISRVPGNCVVTDDPEAFAEAMQRLAADGNADSDGSAFFHSQLEGLDRAVGEGLRVLRGFADRQAA